MSGAEIPAPPVDKLVDVIGVSRRFTKRLDIVGRMAAKMGARVHDEVVHAVDGVDLTIRRGEVVGLVGESGCGKSTLGRMIAGILPPSNGTIRWKGFDRASLRGPEAREATLKAQMIFQDPMSSLNPRMKISEIVGEAPLFHALTNRSGVDQYVDEQLRRAGLDPTLKSRYPHQFSGGQRQRIGIARALAVQPEFLVCDESVAALDVSIQAQILNLFMRLREELDLTYLFISHDLGVVEHLSDRVVIMYLGRIIEEGTTDTVFGRANHPYTKSLIASVPKIEARKKAFAVVQGEIPSPLNPPTGCHFHPRCPLVFDRCRVEVPVLKEVAPGQRSRCHLNDVPTRLR